MLLGKFDDLNKEYVINTPQTPYPWINYLGSEDFFGLFSNTAGGYSFYKDARLRRMTRYRYNNVPVDNEGRYFYINDGSDVWSLGYKPVKTPLDFYECRHGMGYSKIETLKNDIRSIHLAFVPLGDTCEVHQVSLKNESDDQKTFKLYSYIEFCLWDASDDMLNFQRNYNTGEVEVEGSVIYHKTEYRERRNHFSFYSVNTDIVGFDTDRESFMGLYNDVSKPDVVFDNQSKNKVASGWSPIASHCVELTLSPGQEKKLNFVLGYIENDPEDKWLSDNVIKKDRAYEMIERYKAEEDVKDAFHALAVHWEKLLSKFNVVTEDDRVNRMVNIWNAYQCMVTFNLSRSASFFESGVGRGMGFRDSNQDILGFVHQIPERARERLLDIAATQLEDGGAYHQYQPLTKKGNHELGGGFNDDPMWMILSVSAYIKETGDMSILDEMVPYNNDESKADTMLDHLKRSFFHVVNNLGPNGLPLIGRADWNDCLNLNCFSSEPGESFQTAQNKGDGKTAESVFIAGLFILAGKEYVEILDYLGLADESKEAQDHMDAMEKTIMEKGFDGEWFLRAYDAYGNKVGSKENDEGRTFIEPQGICVMAGVGVESGKAALALDKTREYLDSDYGMVLLNPAYTKYHLELGEITSYPPGYKENAGIFCHNNPWVCMAEAEIGRGDEAFEVYSKICPAFLQDEMVKHRTEPYVYSQMIAGKDAVNHGEAKNSWLTGTAAWNYVAITQGILGIKATLTGLKVDPCIPKLWSGFKVTRHFRGGIFNIEVVNEQHVSKGVGKLMVEDIEVAGNIVEFKDEYLGKNVNIKVYLG